MNSIANFVISKRLIYVQFTCTFAKPRYVASSCHMGEGCAGEVIFVKVCNLVSVKMTKYC